MAKQTLTEDLKRELKEAKQELSLKQKTIELLRATDEHGAKAIRQKDNKLLVANELADLGKKAIQIEVAHILFQNILNKINE
jgi:hypothetical protein